MNTNLRQLDICSPSELNEVIPDTVLIGLGGIGSTVMLALAKMGLLNITAYDPDTLEEHNIGNQFLPVIGNGNTFLGEDKSRAMFHLLWTMLPSDRSIDCYSIPFTPGESHYGHLTIVTVDTMATRKAIWDDCQANDAHCRFYIDARMGAQTLRIFTVDMLDEANQEYYGKTLYSDEEALEEPCTARGIIYTSLFAGAHVANIVKQLAVGPQKPHWELNHLIEHNLIVSAGDTLK